MGGDAKVSYAHLMVIESILAQLDAEIARLTQVRSLLADSGKVAAKVTERKAKSAPNIWRPFGRP